MEMIYIAIGGALVLLVLLLVFSGKKKTADKPTVKEPSVSPRQEAKAVEIVEVKTV